MEKKVGVFFAISALMIILNFVLLYRYNAYVSQSSAQGTINLVVETSTACGNGVCSDGETCSSCPADCGSCPVTPPPSGGGGGGAVKVAADFSVDQALIKVMTKQGESFKTSFKVLNTDKSIQNFKIALSPSLKDIVFISESEFSLKAGEEKTIYLTFVSTSLTNPDVYTGNVEISSARIKKIPIIFEVKSKKILFDITLDIPAKYKEISPGEQLFLQLTLFNLGEIGKTDVSVEYIIKDFSGNEIMKQSETIGVETQASFSRTINLPKDIAKGDYVAIAQARYGTSVGSSSVLFSVIEKEKPLPAFLDKYRYLFIAAAFITLVLVIVFALEHSRKRVENIIKLQSVEIEKIRKNTRNKKISQRDSYEYGNKLKKQVDALEKAYSQKYISRQAYLKGRERLQKLEKDIKEKSL